MQLGTKLYVLRLRHARSLKDKRSTVQGLVQKLRNQGFSACEVGDREDLKLAKVGASYVSPDPRGLDLALQSADRLLLGLELVEAHTDRIDYTDPYHPLMETTILDDRDPDD